MDTRKWPWKKRSSDKSCGDSESSESISSHSERFSDDQESMKEIVNDKSHSPEVTSPATIADDEVKESVKSLAEKLSAALVNVSAKEDLVKQHAKVAEEAVAGWEKAENEVAVLKQQLESAVQQNVNLEVKNSHLDGALKECVRQLRQARDEHEKRASDERNKEWESKRVELEKQILELKKENSFLKEELEVVRVERDLITKSAETASKLQLESIKKVTKLEAECRRLQSQARKSIDIDSRASTQISQIDQFKTEKKASTNTLAKNPLQIDMMDDFLEMERLASLPEPDSTDSPLKAELESTMERVAELENMLEKIEAQNSELQNVLDKTVDSLNAAQNRIAEGEIRLEELRNELIVAYETKDSLEIQLETMEEESRTVSSNIDSLKAEIEEERKLSASQSLELHNALEETRNELTAVYEAKESLESKLIAMEAESRTLSSSIDETVDSLKAANGRIEEMQNELNAVYETKESLESQLITMEAESRTLSSSVDSLKKEIEEERKKSEDLKKKCEELENELSAMIEEYEVQQSMHSNGEVKVKQEDLAVAADKLSECQKTIASLGRQLESLATLEDFFIDTSSIPGLSSDNGAEIWRIHSNGGACVSNYDLDLPEMAVESYSHLPNGIKESSSSSPLATNHVTAAKKWNSFPELFSRSKNGRT